MRVLYVDHTAELGGGEIAICNQVLALDLTRFHPVFVLASTGPFVQRLQAAGIETHILPLSATIVTARKDDLGRLTSVKAGTVLGVLKYAIRLARWARRHKVDVIHCNSLKSDIYGGIAGRIAGIPVIWHVRDNISVDYLPKPMVMLFRWFSQWLPTVIVANSHSTKATILGLSPLREISELESQNGAHGRLHVVHDGLAGEIPDHAYLLDSTSRPIVTMVGRISPWKGQHIFLHAASIVCKEYPNAVFQMIGAPLFGEADYEQDLHSLASDLKIDSQVEFTGFISDVRSILEKADIAVHASTIGEPFGQVVIEAMALGKPVIATDGGALSEIVEPEKTGILVPCNDAEALAGAILWMLSHPVERRKLGIAGQQRVREHFTIAHSATKISAVYDALDRRIGSRTTVSPGVDLVSP